MAERSTTRLCERSPKFYAESLDLLFEYIENEFKLSLTKVGDQTLRDHLESLERQTQREDPSLHMQPPLEWSYLLSWFHQLNSARGQGFSGPLPITYTEMEAWARLTKIEPGLFEVDVLRDMDTMFMKIYSEQAAKMK